MKRAAMMPNAKLKIPMIIEDARWNDDGMSEILNTSKHRKRLYSKAYMSSVENKHMTMPNATKPKACAGKIIDLCTFLWLLFRISAAGSTSIK